MNDEFNKDGLPEPQEEDFTVSAIAQSTPVGAESGQAEEDLSAEIAESDAAADAASVTQVDASETEATADSADADTGAEAETPESETGNELMATDQMPDGETSGSEPADDVADSAKAEAAPDTVSEPDADKAAPKRKTTTRRKKAASDEVTEVKPTAKRTVKRSKKSADAEAADRATMDALERVEKGDSAAAPSLDERKAEAKQNAAASRSRIARAGATAESHSDVIRDAAARRREREERQEERIAVLTSWARLKEQFDRKRLSMGTVIGVETLELKDGKKYVAAILNTDGFRTVIPYDYFYYGHDPLDYATIRGEQDLLYRQNQMLNKVLGLRTPFLIMGMDAGHNGAENAVLLGSRKAALEILQKRHFGDGPDAYQEGDDIDVRITAIGPNALRVLVGGMEVQLPKHRTTNRYVENMSEMFCLNDVVKVRIVRLTKKPNGDPEVVLDAREHERNEMAVNLSKIREEGSYRGILTRINFNQRTNRPLFHLHLIDYDVVAVAVGAPNQFGAVPLKPGNTVLFHATHINMEAGYVTGRITRYVGEGDRRYGSGRG